MKKLGIGIGIFLGLILTAIIVIPLVVDVDHYRPQIVEAANQQIQGKLELGKLSLSLWGQIRIEVAGVKLWDREGQEVVSVKDAYFHLPFMPLLSGTPVLSFKMNQPLVSVVKNRKGQLNVMTLEKASGSESKEVAETTGAPLKKDADVAPPSQPPTSLPGFVTQAKLGIELNHAQLTYQDEVTGLKSEVKDLNLVVRDLSLTHPTEIELWAQLETQLGGTFHLRGPVRMTGKAQPTLKDGKVDQVSYQMKVTLDGFGVKTTQMKEQAVFSGMMNVVTDRVESLVMEMKAPGNDLKIQGRVVSFAKPKMDFTVTSTGLDLDQLVIFPPPAPLASHAAAAPASGTTPGGAPSALAKATPPANYDVMLAPLRENKILGALAAQLTLNLKSVKARDVKFSDITCQVGFQDLTASLSQCGLTVFSGKVQSDFRMAMKPLTPTYTFNAQLTGFNLSQAIESQMSLFKNTVKGIAAFKIAGQGASLNPDVAMSNLKANGNLKVTDATFATIDVMRMVSEALNQSLGKIGDKIPGIKGKKIGSLPTGGSKYESISSDFTIAEGLFSAPNFFAKAALNQGVDIKGATIVGLKDNALNTSWEIIDTYNLTRLRDIEVEQNGTKVEHVFAEGSAPVRFPVHAGCTLKAPCYSYAEVPTALGKVALNNIGHAFTGRAKDEVKKKAETLIRQVAPPAMQEELQKKLKGFFN